MGLEGRVPVERADHSVMCYSHLAGDGYVLVDWLVGALGEEGGWD